MSPLTPTAAFGAALVLFVWLASGVCVNLDAHAPGGDYPIFRGIAAPISGVVLAYYFL